ncbi:MAG TPA: hypothetical protein VEG44_05870 [Candidatus Acidoferrales bacterium]|nr:hypothetical protein [Candidatus Acidoferrales bacterium]
MTIVTLPGWDQLFSDFNDWRKVEVIPVIQSVIDPVKSSIKPGRYIIAAVKVSQRTFLKALSYDPHSPLM